MSRGRYVFDVETNGLVEEWETQVADRVHCVVFLDLDSEEIITTTTKAEFDSVIAQANVLVCHNMIDYDLPVLDKLGWIDYTVEPDTINGRKCRFIDTLILSRLLNPKRVGHGLAVWGERLGIAKPDIEDWENQSLGDYIHRCTEDVKINAGVFWRLVSDSANGSWEKAYQLEKQFQHYVSRSTRYGMHFDYDAGVKLHKELCDKMAKIEEAINPLLPDRPIAPSQIKQPPKKRYKKDGSVTTNTANYFGSYLVPNEDGVLVKHPNGIVYDLGDPDIPPLVVTQTMTINNQQDLKNYLLSLGWNPTFYNTKDGERTSPRFNDEQTKEICPNLFKMGDKHPWIAHLTEWLMLRHRRNLLKGNGTSGLLNCLRLEWDSRLPAGMNTIGAATHRVTHRVVANLPRVSTPYGKEIRALFNSPKDKVIVGFDASSLEDRLKGHYTYKYDGGAYANKINNPEYDAHTESAELWGISRSDAKTGNYAIQFGAGVAKFAKGLGVDNNKGKRFYDMWWDNNAGLRDFKHAAEYYWEKEGKTHVRGLDGRNIPCDSQHIVVNRIIQSAGAIVMKTATVLFHKMIEAEGLDAHMTEFYHDELVVECDPKDAQLTLDIGIKSIILSGEALGLAVSLDADGAIGDSWADVH